MRGRRRAVIALQALLTVPLLLLPACQEDEDEPGEGPPPVLIDEPIIRDDRDESGRGIVIVELEDGTGVYFFESGPYPVDVRPMPVSGDVVHWQHHVLELPDGSSEERWVVVSASGEGEDRTTTVTVYGPDPANPPGLREIESHTHDGDLDRTILNETAHEKTFLFGDDGWLIVDLIDGSIAGSSTDAAPDDVVSIEVVSGFIVVIETWNNETEIRLRVFGPTGQIVATIVMPGDYVTSTTDGADLKAIVTRHNGTVFQDLIRVSTGTMLTQRAGNGITGGHAHLQYDPTGGGRFMEVVYHEAMDETEVRIMDASGNVLATHVLPGRFKRAVVAGTPPGSQKVIATEKNGRAAATTFDLTTGRQGSITQANGPYTGLTAGPGGVVLDAGGQSLPVRVP